MERLIGNPMPVPWGLVLKKVAKIRSGSSVGSPTPLSLTARVS